jgi:membrane protein DedA with SNARE-associated domain
MVRKPVLVLTSLLFIFGTIGTNIGPALVDEHPLLVLTMSSRNRNLFGSVPFTSPVPYFIIGFLRILAAAVALYFVGRWYGDRTVRWVENNVGEMPALYRWIEKAVNKAGWLMLFFMPGSNVVCVLVGHRQMRIRQFFAVIIPAICFRLIVMRIGGDIFEDQVRWFLKSIENYQWYIVLGLFAISAFQMNKRRPLAPPDRDGSNEG